MRIKINHFNIGAHQEVTLVCTRKDEDYFSRVAKILTNKYAVRTGLFLYDYDPLDEKTKQILNKSYYVLFMLTPGVTEDSVSNPNHRFRQVFRHVNKHNPYSISLVAVNGCQVDYSLQFPEDMRSFNWLHRKNFYISYLSPVQIAEEFYQEFRLSFSRREKVRLEKLAADGCQDWQGLFAFQSTPATVFLLSCIAFAISTYLIDSRWYSASGNAMIRLGVGFTFIASLIAVIISIAVLIARAIFLRDQLYDVSTVFADFRRITVKRLTFFLGIGIVLGLLLLIDASGSLTPVIPSKILLFTPLLIMAVTLRVKIMLQLRCAVFSNHYIDFCQKNLRIRHICRGILVAAPLLAVAAELIARVFQ